MAAWVSQFATADQADAAALVKAMTLVTRDEFGERLAALIRERGCSGQRPVGLYAERELRRRLGIPNRLFKETKGKVKRATGAGPEPVKSTRDYDLEVGSEGLVAQIITELCREPGSIFLNHPRPDAIRRKRVRRFIVVTDLIGSGRRARDYLEAAWRVRSVRSWSSWRLLRFEVLAYAATEAGRSNVEKHHSRPLVQFVTPCPTIESEFQDESGPIRNLCIRYDPMDHDPIEFLGVGGIGALIAFAHGVPNNAPRILHKARGKWAPLFPARITANLRSHFGQTFDPDAVAARLRQMRQTNLARGPWLHGASPNARLLILVTAALSSGPKGDEALARRTGLTILDIRRWVTEGARLGWVDGNRRLTDRGQRELAYARRRLKGKKNLPVAPKDPYYPRSLRAPRSV